MDKAVNLEHVPKLCGQLSGPALSLDRLSLCDHHPDIFKLFIDRLAGNTPGNIGKLLYGLLKELAALDIPTEQKLTLLNLVRPVTLQCADKLSRIGLSPKTAKTVSLSQALLKHLATGFRTVVASIGANTGTGTEDSDELPLLPLAQAISHTLDAQGIMYLKSQQFYLGTPNKFWVDVHLLYRIAQCCQIADKPHPGKHRGDQLCPTIQADYFRLLLLACCTPNQMSGSDLSTAFQALSQWADMISLTPGKANGLFVVNTDSDLPPFYSSKLAKGDPKPQRIDLERLTNYLDNRLNNEPDAAQIDKVTPRLARTLCQSWSVETQRQSERDSKQHRVELIYGLSFIHNALSSANSFETYLSSLNTIDNGDSRDKFQLERLLQNTGANQKNGKTVDEPDIWRHAPDVSSTTSAPAARAMTMVGPASEQSEEKRSNTLPAVFLNTSKEGACLEFSNGQSPKLAPGEIIAWRNSDSDPWQLGLVRWKRVTPHLAMQLGIEFLLMTAVPRAARILRLNRPAGPYLPALLLQSEENKTRPSQIVVPIMPFKQGDQVHLLGGKRGMMAQLSVPIDSTGFISRFTLNDIART